MALAASGLLVAVCIGLEAALRLFSPPPPSGAEAKQRAYLELLDRLDRPIYRIAAGPGGPWFVSGDTKRDPERFAVKKPARVRRIVFVGESSANMLYASARELLGKGNGRLELINLAVGGSSLDRTQARMRESLRYDPDAVVLMFGHNLFYAHPPSSRVYRWGLWARKSAVLSRIAGSLSPGGRAELPERERWGMMERFLRGTAAELRRRGVRLVLCTVPTNLRFPPREELAERADPDYLRALLLRDAGRHSQARDALTRLLQSRPTALRHYTLARWLLQGKDYPGAQRHFIAARDMDGARDRASSAVNQLIRTAAARESSTLLDFDEMVKDDAPHGIPGWESFMDYQHVSWSIFFSEARLLMDALGALWPGMVILPGSVLPPLATEPYPKFVESQIEAPDDRWGASLVDYFEQALADSAKSPRPRDPASASYRFHVDGDSIGWGLALAPLSAAEAAWRSGNAARALDLSAAAAKAAPLWAEVPYRRGVYQLSLGRQDEARKCFAQALALDPAKADAAARLSAIRRAGSR